MAMEKTSITMTSSDLDLFERGRCEQGINMSKSAYIRLLIAEHEDRVPSFIKYKEIIEKISELNTLLEAELSTTKEQLAQAKTALSAAQAEKDALVAEYEKAIAEGDEEAAAALQQQIAEKQAVIEQLEATQEALQQKEKDILEAQNTITSLQNQIDAKNKEIADLQKQLDALSGSANGFAMTVETANDLFGLTLSAGATDEEVYNAIVAYVQDKLSTDQTIAAIQALVNSNNTGTALVNDVEAAINAGGGNTGNTECDHEGMIDDSVVDSSSNNYKTGYSVGYNAGYAEGTKANSGSGSGNTTDSTTIASLTAQVESLNTQVSTLTSKNKKLTSEVEDLEDEISDLKAEKKTLSSKVSSLTDKNSELSDSVDSLTSKNSQLSSSVSSLTNKNTELTNTVNSLTAKNTELSGSIDTLTSNNTSLNTKVNALTKSNDALADEVSSLKTQLQKSTSTSKETVATNSTNKEEKTTETVKDSVTDESETEVEEITMPMPEKETKPDALVSGTLTSVENVGGLGSVVQLEMEEVKASSAASNQKGTGAIIKLPENGNAISTINTNGSEAGAVSVESINNAYVIMDYYTNHLAELGELGSAEITSAAKDSSKAVILETVLSADIKPSSTQEAAIKNGVTTKVNVSFDGIDNNSLYLVIHESEVRQGTYDVTMVKPKNGMLEFSLEDLSPITIAKVRLDDVSSIDLTEQESVESVNVPEEGTSSNTLRNVVYVLIIVALLIGLSVLAYLKLKDSSFIKDEEDEEE